MKTPSTLSLDFVEPLFEAYKADPRSVTDDWRAYFAELEALEHHGPSRSVRLTIGHQQLIDHEQPAGERCDTCGRSLAVATLQSRVTEMIRNYRVRGHRRARVNPLSGPLTEVAELNPVYYGFIEGDLHLRFEAGTLGDQAGELLTLHEIIERLERAYCGAVGVQFMHIDDIEARTWIQARVENWRERFTLSREQQLTILTKLTDAVTFERFIQTKFVGAKSFSLEGAESLIPLLHLAIEKAGAQGVDEVVLAMPHRGRLNVLANIMGKHPRQIFGEFKDANGEELIGRGDVKYHLGHHRDWVTATGRTLHLDLVFNPSHLEFAGPVALGRMRAKLDRIGDTDQRRGLAILMHGDAAFAGEGIVQETLNLSELPAYAVGGALHIVVNNQIGFTTTPEQSRSSVYATDVARMLQIPVFHVNGEDPEAVAQVVELALDYRLAFHRDVVVDMFCYRRRGHNESDEPAFTQPLMYRAIKEQKTVRQSYLDHLLELGELTRDEGVALAKERHEYLEQELGKTDVVEQETRPVRAASIGRLWQRYRGGPDAETPEVQTSVEEAQLTHLLKKLCELPEGFRPHPKIRKWLDQRQAMAEGREPLDWGAGEALALASLAAEGAKVRLTGQDSERGTFSHRHAVLHDVESDARYLSLAHLKHDQARVEIHNSPLSEGAVLGFEYGYSLSSPDGLVLWEAQFGDFANVAQVYIDQFLASAESKWQQLCGLVLLLPHGLEGSGPEHASARQERFLSLAASDNYQVASPTTPAQLFHLLRRQVHRPWRKPLVVMSPKSMLRHPRVVSPLEDFAAGQFQRILSDREVPANAARRVLLCNGKVFYDLQEEREKSGRQDIALVRLEQLYPLSHAALREALAGYKDGTEVVWVQEEPRNMGALPYLALHFASLLRRRFRFASVSRPESSSPATGSAASHRLEQRAIVTAAFGALPAEHFFE